jgi:hypothetical protein
MSNKRIRRSTINEKIDALELQSASIRRELEKEFETGRKKAIGIGKIALGVTGGVIVSAFVLRGIFGGKKQVTGGRRRSKRVYHKVGNQLLSEFSAYALEFLLGVAIDRLRPHLRHRTNQEDDDSPGVQ